VSIITLQNSPNSSEEQKVKNQITGLNLTILNPSGYITAANVREFQEQLRETLKHSTDSKVLVNLKQVEFLDSAGLMALASALRLAQDLGKHLSLCSVPSSVQMILEITQLDRVFEVFDNQESFKAAMLAPVAA
jgi:anti-sigma B factor antagonist